MKKAIKAKKCGFRRAVWKFSQGIRRGWQLGYLKILLCLVVFAFLSILKYWAELESTIKWKNANPNFWWTLLNGLTDPNTLSVFTGAIITVLIWQFSQIFATLSEERRKTNQDQHAMIRRYSAYAPERDENGFEIGGAESCRSLHGTPSCPPPPRRKVPRRSFLSNQPCSHRPFDRIFPTGKG